MKRRPKPPIPAENLAADTAAILQIKIWLTGISPMVWRRVLVPASFTLRELHGVIQVAMGWEGIEVTRQCSAPGDAGGFWQSGVRRLTWRNAYRATL